MMKALKGVLLFLISVTWCALQTVVGALFALALVVKGRFFIYRGMIVVYHPYSFTFSLGTFAFVSEKAERPREVCGRMYGYYLLSLSYGPLYLFAVILPHLIVEIPAVKLRREERGSSERDLSVDRQAAYLQARFGE